MKHGRVMQDREERSNGIEIHISDDFVIIKPTVPFKLVKHEAKEAKLVRFLWQFIIQSRCFTVSVQKQQEDKFIIHPSSSVHG